MGVLSTSEDARQFGVFDTVVSQSEFETVILNRCANTESFFPLVLATLAYPRRNYAGFGLIEQGLTSHSTHFRSFRRRWGDCGISQDCSRSQSPELRRRCLCACSQTVTTRVSERNLPASHTADEARMWPSSSSAASPLFSCMSRLVSYFVLWRGV